jgi:glycosyltransferase involved in cell wall biosynthesis
MSQQYSHRADIPPLASEVLRPLWSVMIPTHNCAHYLRETLSSVLAQDPGADLMQIEVIDDHSTKDDPKSVVEELAINRINFYQQSENVGKSRNYETCLKRARGHFIHILHGDDYVLNNFYTKMSHVFDENPNVGGAFCRNITMNLQGHWQGISPLIQEKSGIINDFLEKMLVRNVIDTPSIVLKREIYEHLGGFDERLHYVEDWEMWLRAGTQYQFAYLPEVLAAYRERELTLLSPDNILRQIQTQCECTSIMQSYLSSSFSQDYLEKKLNKAKIDFALSLASGKITHLFAEGDINNALKLMSGIFQYDHSFATLVRVLSNITYKTSKYMLSRFIHI